MPAIYDQHSAAFANVSAFVILKDGKKVATVALKFPRDGAGRLYAYVHWLGLEMVRGFAGGYGYDKRSAAVADALGKMPVLYPVDRGLGGLSGYDNFRGARLAMDSDDWTRALERAGFTVLQAV